MTVIRSYGPDQSLNGVRISCFKWLPGARVVVAQAHQDN